MSITLTDEDLEIIEGWYNSAAGESASGISVTLRCDLIAGPRGDAAYEQRMANTIVTKALLDKLGFKYHSGDEYNLRQAGML